MSYDPSSSNWERVTLDDVSVYKQFRLTDRMLRLNEEVENIIAWRSTNNYSLNPRDEVELCDTLRTALKLLLMSLEPIIKTPRSSLKGRDYWDGPLELGEIEVPDNCIKTNIPEEKRMLTGLKDFVELPNQILALTQHRERAVGMPIRTVSTTTEVPIPWEVLERGYRYTKQFCDAVGLSLSLDTSKTWSGTPAAALKIAQRLKEERDRRVELVEGEE